MLPAAAPLSHRPRILTAAGRALVGEPHTRQHRSRRQRAAVAPQRHPAGPGPRDRGAVGDSGSQGSGGVSELHVRRGYRECVDDERDDGWPDLPAEGDRARRLRKKLADEFGRWWSHCDADGRSDLGGFLARTVRSLVVNGEAFVHLESDPAAAALQLRLWNVNQVDRSMNRDIGGGFRIVAGIEFDPRGRRLAYHVRENPDAPFATNYGTVRVPAEDVLHVFEPLFPGQVRGLSWLAPSLTRIAEIDKGEDANLARLNASALFAGFLTKPSESAPDVLPMAPNAPSVDMEPGAFVQIPPGYSVEFSTPPSGDGAVDFTRAMIRSAAAGAGVPYELVSGDLSQVNYSSARLGLSEFRQRVTAIRRNIIIPQFLDPSVAAVAGAGGLGRPDQARPRRAARGRVGVPRLAGGRPAQGNQRGHSGDQRPHPQPVRDDLGSRSRPRRRRRRDRPGFAGREKFWSGRHDFVQFPPHAHLSRHHSIRSRRPANWMALPASTRHALPIFRPRNEAARPDPTGCWRCEGDAGWFRSDRR